MLNHKRQAMQIIDAIAADCQMDPAIYQTRTYTENVQEIASNLDYLKRAVDGEVLSDATNPAYHHFDEVVVKLLQLSIEYPQVFHSMFLWVMGDMELRSLVGLRAFTNFLRLIVDDHEYRLDSSSGLPVVIDVENSRCPMIAPAMLYHALSKIC